MREGERRYRELFEANPHPMWVYDTETLRFLAVNDAAVQRYGYARDEFLAMTVTDIRPPEDVPALLADDRRPGRRAADPRGVAAPVEGRHAPRRRGDRPHCPAFDGRPARLVLALDVTDRLRAEGEAGRSLARLRAVVESMADGLVVADPEGNLLDWNPAALRMHGYASVEEARRHLSAFAATFTLSRPGGPPLPVPGVADAARSARRDRVRREVPPPPAGHRAGTVRCGTAGRRSAGRAGASNWAS